MKTLALIARRPDLSRAEFRDHYEDVHAPLAVRTLLEGTTRYVRHHLRDTLFGRPAFDVVTAFWYRDAAAAAEIMRRTETPAGEAIRQDELTFMDKPANTFFAVTERVVRGAEDRDAALAAIALVRRPAGADAARFLDVLREGRRCRACSTRRARRRGASRTARCASAAPSPRSTR